MGFTTTGGRPQQKVTLDGPPPRALKTIKYVHLSSHASHAAGWFAFALMIGLLM